jgi:hypothetical protein
MAAHRRGIPPELAAELVKQARLHGSEKTVYLLQVALNDVAGWKGRWVPEHGIPCAATIHFARTTEDPASVAQRIRDISPPHQMARAA